MRIGLLGPAGGEHVALREAAEFLVADLEVDRTIYLGEDDAIERLVREGSEVLRGPRGAREAFLERAAQLAASGEAGQIEALLRADAELRRLGSIQRLPPPPARAVEMLEDRIVLIVHDKSNLDEEDIVNAQVIVYGRSKEMLLKRFGARYFFTPGPLSGQKVGVLELEADGSLTIAAYAPSGAPLWREALQAKGTKLSVSR